MSSPAFLREITSSIVSSCRSLIVTNLLFKLLTFLLITPLFVFLFRGLLAVAGGDFLSDVDIVFFFVSPAGWLCLILVGGVWLEIIALGQAALLAIMAAQSSGKRISVMAALRFAASNANRIFPVTARMIAWGLVTLLPFGLISFAVCSTLLGEYDINFYLQARPPEFLIAVAIGGVLAVVLCAILLRLYSSWFLALPLVLFDRVAPREALSKSASLASGHRQKILIWLVTWVGLVVLANTVSTILIGSAGRLLVPTEVTSLVLLSSRIGLLLLVLSIVGLALNLVAAITFASVLFKGFRGIHDGAVFAIEATAFTELPDKTAGRWLTQRRIIGIAVVGVVLVSLLGYWSLRGIQLNDNVQIMAHRGASKSAPENSMAAFRQAIQGGADWIELDVQETADGEVVVLHDSDFMKLADNSLKIWDANLEDLSSIDIGSSFAPEFASERVPTLAEVLQLCRGKIGVNIELKYYGHDQNLEQRVVDIVEAEQMVDQVMIMSLKPKGVAKVKKLRPDWKCGLLLSVQVGDLNNIDVDFLAVNAQFASRGFVNRAHAANKEVFVWTVNDAVTMSQMLNRRVDGILTDRPKLAQQVLAERADMSSSERLLTEISFLLGGVPATEEQ